MTACRAERPMDVDVTGMVLNVVITATSVQNREVAWPLP